MLFFSNNPRWLKIYKEIEDGQVNDVLTYERLCEVAGVVSPDKCRADVYRAIKELLLNKQRTMENVRTVGYRIVAANEHVRIAKNGIRSIKRKNRKVRATLVNTRREELTMEERQQLAELELKVARHTEMLERLNVRQSRLENTVKAVRRQHSEVSAEMESRVERLESQISALRESSKI